KGDGPLMSERFAYGIKPVGSASWTLVEADPKYTLPTLDDAQTQQVLISDGLVEGVRKIAERMADSIRPRASP
ncbi:MAG: hypothetical protein ABIU95_04100, partial [Burkholderiales bacterium]